MLMNVNLLFAIWANNFQLMNEYLIMKKRIQKSSLISTIEFPVAELGGAFNRICMSLISRWIMRVCISRLFANRASMSAAKTFLGSWKSGISNCELETLMLTSFKTYALRDFVAVLVIMLMKTLLIQCWCLKTDMII